MNSYDIYLSLIPSSSIHVVVGIWWFLRTQLRFKLRIFLSLTCYAVFLICPVLFLFYLTTLFRYHLSLINCIYLMGKIGWVLTDTDTYETTITIKIPNIAVVSLWPFAIHLSRCPISREPLVLPVLKRVFWLWTKLKIIPRNAEISHSFSVISPAS